MKEKNLAKELTVEEVIQYEKNFKKVKQVYGKYGNLAKDYIENHNQGKLMTLAGELPKYLHNIDRQAEDLYGTLWEKLSSDEKYKRTGDYMEDVRRMNEMKSIIDEEILNEIVYVK